jgi:uncharacterized membrane protein YqjE
MEHSEEEKGKPPRGVFGSLQRLLATLLELVETRIELVATELEEQRLRFAHMLLAALVTLFLVGMATLFITLFVVVAVGETYRIAVLGGFAGLYVILAIIAAVVWHRCARARPRLFDATISELRKDREQMGPRP